MTKEKKKAIWGMVLRGLIIVILIAAVIGGLYLLFRHLGYTDLSKEQLRDMIEKTGVWGPLVFILVSFLQVTFVPIPGAVTILAGNLLFGPWLSALYSLIGMMLGAMLAFFLGRWMGRKFVNWVVGDKDKVEEYLNKMRGKEEVVLFFMFLLPLFPDDALCAIAGVTPMSWMVFFLMQLVTRPISIFGTILFMSGEVIPYEGWGLVVLALVGVASIVAFIFAYKYSDAIHRWLYQFTDRLTGKKKEENIEENEINEEEQELKEEKEGTVEEQEEE